MITPDYAAGLICGEGWFGLSVQKVPRLKLKHGFKIEPRFSIQMNDTETMVALGEALKSWGLPVYYDPGKHGTRIGIAGLKRVSKYAEFFGPLLTGKKREAADIVLEFCRIRLEKKAPTPYGAEEAALVNRLRSVNGMTGGPKILLEPSETTRRASHQISETKLVRVVS